MSFKHGVAGECRAITSSGGLFGDFFASQNGSTFAKNSLLDGRARRLFDLTRRACQAGLYPYQLPLEGRSGPWVEAEGRRMLMLSSYDYLGLIGDPRVDEGAIAAVRKYGTGTGGARMLTGTIDLHHEMERDLAAFKGTRAAITFGSGYLANLAAVTSVLSPADSVVMDALSHRSLSDACKLAGVTVRRYAHNDCASLRKELVSGPQSGRTLIVADGVFSMEGDICNLPELIAIKQEFGCHLLVDESHALGVIGPSGRGTDEHFGVSADGVDMWTGSLAKGIPSNGGFIAATQELSIYLQHAAAPFIFSGALCPAAVGAIRASLAILRSEPERVERLRSNARFLREGLRDLGYDTGMSETAIVPVMLGDDVTTARFAGRMRELGIAVTPVMFPAVAQGIARLRLCATAAHSTGDLEFALDVFRRLRDTVGLG